MLIGKRCVASLACAILMLAGGRPAVAQDGSEYLVVATSPSDWLVERMRSGCMAADANLNTRCVIEPSDDINQKIATIESFIAAGGGMGIVLQVSGGGNDAAFMPVVKKAAESQVPVVVVSTTVIEAASPFFGVARTIVGVSAESYASGISEATKANLTSADTSFCVLGIAGAPPVLALANQSVTKAVEELGVKEAGQCPEPVQVQGAFDEAISSAVNELLKAEDVRFVVLPFLAGPELSGRLKEIAAGSDRETIFISAWASPYTLSYAAAHTLLDLRQGMAVDEQREIAPAIQISTGKYCDACDCEKETECKEACSKCN